MVAPSMVTVQQKRWTLLKRVIEMLKVLKNKRGTSIVEIIVAMAILGMLSMPIGTMFLNSLITIRITNDRIELNGVTGIIKDCVVKSVKLGGGNIIHTYDINPADNQISVSPDGVSLKYINDSNAVSYINGYKLKVIDNNNEINTKYMFDAEKMDDFSTTDPLFENVYQYKITIKRISDGVAVQSFYINIYKYK